MSGEWGLSGQCIGLTTVIAVFYLVMSLQDKEGEGTKRREDWLSEGKMGCKGKWTLYCS